jgi:hypothetical protein
MTNESNTTISNKMPKDINEIIDNSNGKIPLDLNEIMTTAMNI